MIDFNVRVLHNRFPQIASGFEPKVADAINTGVFDLIAAADPLTPVDTGTLKNSKQLDMASPGNLSAKVTWTAEYAFYVEGGTTRMAAQPYAGPAADQVFPPTMARIAAAIEGLG